MRSLRMLIGIVVVLSVAVSIARAQIAYFYVANSTSNLVSVYNSGNDTFVENVAVGTSPWGVAVNQAGTLVYVTNNGSNTVSVISTSTNAVVATIPVGTAPFGVAFTPDGTRAYVANGNSNSVSVINTATKKVTATVTVGNYPIGITVMPNGSLVYVTNSVSGTVSVISTVTNKVVATIPVGIQPYGVAIAPNGATAYVTNAGSNTVSVIQTGNNAVVNTISVSPGPAGGAVSPDGQYLYVANSDNNEGNLVTIINTGTQTVQTTVVVGTGPQQITFTEGSYFAAVTNITSNNLSVIDTASMTVVATYKIGAAPIGSGIVGLYHVSTLVGGYVGDGGAATSAAITLPYNTVQDKAGNYYVTDRYINRLRKITPGGTITTFAGTGICGYNGDNIPSTEAMLCYPSGLAIDSAGNLYVSDSGNSRIRKINAKGIISTVVGNGEFGYSGDGGLATNAEVGGPWDLTFDPSGNLYFSDIDFNVVRKVNHSGIITTYAGDGIYGFSGDGGPATSAMMEEPVGVAFYTTGYRPESCGPEGCQETGNLYIGDYQNSRVRIVTAQGTINTFAGNGQFGCGGDGGPATAANLGFPIGATINNGVLYIADNGCDRARAINLTSNIISTFAGSYGGYDGDGNPPLSSRFNGLRYMLFNSAGNAVIDDADNGRVRMLSEGVFSTIAGGYIGDGNAATSAALVQPEALAIDNSGSIYIADANRIRKVSAGNISTIAGNSVNGYSGDGGPATSALLSLPQGVAVDSSGNVFIADSNNNVIRRVDGRSGNISTFASNSNPNAPFCYLQQMAIDSADNLYVADECTSVIFKITPAAVVSVFAGVPFNYGYNGDNIPATAALLEQPFGVAVDQEGDVIIADTYNYRVREVNPSGTISTIAGDGNCSESGDGGPAAAAEVCEPFSAAVSSSGTIYIDDDGFGRIRQISGGIITALAGSEGGGFNGDGLWPLLRSFLFPVAVAVDSEGAVYVLDYGYRTVSKIQ